jgi:hypothetical protein
MRRNKNRIDKLSSSVNRFVYDLTSEDIEEIEAYDQSHGYYSKSDEPRFEGDLMDDDAYNQYLDRLKEWERTQVKFNYNGKLKTRQEIDNIELRTSMEQSGWNIRNLYGNKEREEKLKRIQKQDKKREKMLREQLIKTQERRKRHMGDDVYSKKSKKKKKGKTKKKTSSEDSSL